MDMRHSCFVVDTDPFHFVSKLISYYGKTICFLPPESVRGGVGTLGPPHVAVSVT